ncbi:metalloregulator ArsR/SmtB family transcription factor [Amycolatopsis sp. NPDC026612]|uniref:metalloregulator ArsR/SmtB family transcription factor n=1 Tax=Amycolatopsis sp. NPDC026612 TaxID=3155466 RepID=UPI0033DE0B19
MPILDEAVPPPFVRLASDPLRWRLMRELAAGDRRVRELVEAVGQSQNLVSYHLRKLRSAELVRARRSSFDGRDTYYHLDLERCADALAQAGTLLHPGLAAPVPPTRTGARRRVLFVCTGNSGRSPMAAALLRHRADAESVSAGSHPKPLHPDAVRVMGEYGITLTHEPTHLDAVGGQRFDWVISLCDRVREVCPPLPGRPPVIHWSIPDPAREADAAGDTYPAFRRVAAELDGRIRFLIRRFEPPNGGPGPQSEELGA